MDIIVLFQVLILIMSIVIHEVSHGYAALWMGDVTAKYAGRLTMNPIKHIDLFGSIILPAILIFTGSRFLIGWAKPVPYNPYNLRNLRWGEFTVAIAGPLSNISIAILMSLFIKISPFLNINLSLNFVHLAFYVIAINLFLAFFNLIPIPPLDGSKVLFNLFPTATRNLRLVLENQVNKIIIIVIFFFFLLRPLSILVFNLAHLLAF